MAYHIEANGLTKTYRIPVREAGLRSAFGSLFRPQFNEVKAVDEVSFAIERGEMVGFIGPNGAGKTTTLKMLSGLLYPTSGSATAAGFTPGSANPNISRRSACSWAIAAKCSGITPCMIRCTFSKRSTECPQRISKDIL